MNAPFRKPHTKPKSILELRDVVVECRAIVTPDGVAPLYCAAPVSVYGGSYCDAHADRYFNTWPPSARRGTAYTERNSRHGETTGS